MNENPFAAKRAAMREEFFARHFLLGGWLGGTEYFIPELCRRAVETGRTQYWGHGEITPQQARQLMALAERAGCWADTDYYSVGYDSFQPFPIPPEYVEAIEREQSSEYARRRQQSAEPFVAPDGADHCGSSRGEGSEGPPRR